MWICIVIAIVFAIVINIAIVINVDFFHLSRVIRIGPVANTIVPLLKPSLIKANVLVVSRLKR